MKKYSLLFLLFFTTFSFSQNNFGKNDDLSRIALNVLIPDDNRIPDESKLFLENKLNQITSYNGLGGLTFSNPRFILSSSITEINKEQMSESVLYYYNLDFDFYVIDVYEKKIFNSAKINLKGVGNTQSKAYNDAIKRIDPKSNTIASFLEKGKMKIIEYYNTQCEFIKSNANTLAKQNKYDEALYTLELVPDVCKTCYTNIQSSIIDIYNQKINYECQNIIAKAKGLIANDSYDEAANLVMTIMPNTNCYKEASSLLNEIKNHKCSVNIGKAKGALSNNDIEQASKYLSNVSVDSKCAIEAQKLIEEVKKISKEKDAREWKLNLKSQEDEVSIRMAAIDAARAIGVAFGNSQPKTIIYNNFKRFW